MQSNRLILGLIVVLHCFLIAPLLKAELSWPNYLLLFVLVVSSLYFGLAAVKAKGSHLLKSSDRLTKFDYLFSTLLVVLTATISKMYINKYTVWLDESDAGLNSLVDDMVVSAANYQQPPLDYLYRHWGLMGFGLNEVGLRFTSAAAYCVFIVVSYFNFLKISKNSVFSFCFAVLLALNDWIIRYAIEARPYSLGLCYFAFFSYFVISILMDEDSAESSHVKFELFSKPDVKLTFITFFWLMSISMQPFLFVISSLVICAGYYLWTKNLKIKSITLQMLLGLAIFVPFQLKIISVSTKYLNPSLGVNDKILQSLNNSLVVFLELFTHNAALAILFVIFLTVILLGISSTPKKKIVLFCLALFLAYAIALLLFFAFKIDWPMAYRYLLLNLAMFFYLVFVAGHYYREGSHQLKKYVVLLFCAIVSLGSLDRYNLNEIHQVDWRGLYQTIQQKTVTKADAYIYAFNTPDYVGTDGVYMASDFYDTAKLELRGTRGSVYLHHFEYIESFIENKDVEAFIAIDKMTLNPEIFWKIKVADAELFETRSFFVVHKRTGVPIFNFAEQFLGQLEQHFPDSPKKFRLHLDLFELKILKSKCKEAKKHLDILSQLDLPPHEVAFRKQKYKKICK